MWIFLAFLSAMLLGFYDVAKKQSLTGNAVLPVLFLNTLFSLFLTSPLILMSLLDLHPFEGSLLDVRTFPLRVHLLIFLKSVLVLSSWILGYIGMKHLPLTIVGPVNATRPVMVLLGALLLFQEHLNLLQWGGVALSVLSFYKLSRSGRREGVDFLRSPWALSVIMAAVLGALSGLYDKYLLSSLHLPPLLVQSWNSLYQFLVISPVLLALWYPSRKASPFLWRWSIPLISVLITAADLSYFVSLSLDGAMVSVVSMVRRSSVAVSFLYAALVLREKNLRSKTVDLMLVLLGLLLLCLGSLAD